MTRSGTAIALAAALAACGGDSPNLPAPPPSGEGIAVPNEGWAHVPEGSAITYAHNPPASGPHYPVWLRYEEYTTPMARGYWVHNLEHGAIVVLYRPDAPGNVIPETVASFRAIPVDAQCGHRRALLTPDPLLPWPAAVVAADRVLRADNASTAVIVQFALARRGRGPENVCDQGTRP
jgi:hypothetical protein